MALVFRLVVLCALAEAPPLFLPPGCTVEQSLPDGWEERLLAGYAAEHADFARRLGSLPAPIARAVGLNATLLAVSRAVAENTHILRALLGAAPAPIAALGDAPRSTLCCAADQPSPYASASDVLAHLARDWAAGSPAASVSAALARLLAHHLPAARSRVLVLGAGGCGLAVALADAGFTVEANDSSLPVLRAVQALLLLGRGADKPCPPPLAVRAAVLADANVRWRAAQLRPARVSACSRAARRPRARAALRRLSLQLGSFGDAALYAAPAEARSATAGGRRGWDGVTTQFALDAMPMAPHEVIAAVRAVLRPGGVWLFAGPLAYHDPAGPPLTMDELVSLLEPHNFTLRARRAFRVDSYGGGPPEQPGVGWRRGWGAAVGAACALLRASRVLLPLACAQSSSMARLGFEAEAFVARLGGGAS